MTVRHRPATKLTHAGTRAPGYRQSPRTAQTHDVIERPPASEIPEIGRISRMAIVTVSIRPPDRGGAGMRGSGEGAISPRSTDLEHRKPLTRKQPREPLPRITPSRCASLDLRANGPRADTRLRARPGPSRPAIRTIRG